MKIKDDNGREYILIDDALVDITFYFILALSVALTVLAMLLFWLL